MRRQRQTKDEWKNTVAAQPVEATWLADVMKALAL